MASISRRRLHVLGWLVPLILTACGGPSLEAVMEREGMTRDSVVMLEEDRALAARTADPGVEVLDFSRGPDGWSAEVRAGSPNGPSDGSVHIASGGADPTNEWSTYVYGTARPNVSRVVLPGLDGQGGQVVDGAWVIGVKSGDVAVGQLAWQFLDATGNVVKSGQGPYPPAP